MSTQKFNTQTGYNLDVNNITSKIRLDFDTNLNVDVQDAVLGLDPTSANFVLIDQSLVTQTDTDGFISTNIGTTNGSRSGSVKNYVFEKLIDPSVAGCENCGSEAKYIPEGVGSSGDIQSLDVLPIVNKQVIAEFEVSPEAYHSLEIDLVGHRRVCNDSGNCFIENIETPSELGAELTPIYNKPWTYKWFYPNTNWQNDPFRQLDSNKDVLTAKSYSETTPTTSGGEDITQFPPYNAPDHMDFDVASTLRMIDYSCCKCCYYYEEYVRGNITQTEAIEKCSEHNPYYIAQVVNSANTFFAYCSEGRDRRYLDYDSKTIEESVSHCELISRKLDQYNSFPDATLPNCLNSTYDGLNQPVEFSSVKCQILIRCCDINDPNDTPYDDEGGLRCCFDGTENPCCDATCACNVNPCGTDTTGAPCPENCTACPNDPRCGINCNQTPCDPSCPLNCTACPNDPRCGVDCNQTPCDPNCSLDCVRCPSDSRCTVDCNQTPCDQNCPLNCARCPNDPRCGVDCNQTPCDPSCPLDCDACPNDPRCVCILNPCDPSCPLDCDACPNDPRCGGGGGTSSTIHDSTLINYNGSLLDNNFVLGRCRNVTIDKNIYMVNRTSTPCTTIPQTTNDTKNYCSLTANSFRNIFDDVSWHLLGGHFYANKELRDFIYKQTGTIHFSSSVNANLLSYQLPEETHSIYHIDTVVSDNKEYYLANEKTITAPSFYDNASAYISIGNSYISEDSTKTPVVPKQSYLNVATEIYYDDGTENYLSRYQTSNQNRTYYATFYSGSGTPQISANLNQFTRDAQTTVSVSSSSYSNNTDLIDTGSYISDTQFSSWPLSNMVFTYTPTGKLSHTLNTTNPNWSVYNDTLYHNTITPISNIIEAQTGSITSSVSYKRYLVNNGIRQDFTLITDSRSFATATSNYENYKFFGRLVDDETVEITNGNAAADSTNNLLFFNTTGILTAKILNEVFNFNDITSQVDPIVITINAYTSGSSAGSTKLNLTIGSENLDQGTLVKSFSTTGDLNLGGVSNSGKITIKLDRKVSNFTQEKIYYFMFKIKKPIKGFTDSITYDKTSTFKLTPQIVAGQDNSVYQFNPYHTHADRTKSSTLGYNEFPLFTIDSARFATPDYASYDATPKQNKANYDQQVIPMRGLQYQFYKKDPNNTFGVMSEVDDYPIIRTIRKNNGKFYVQILAGAFAYYHPLVHEAVLKKIGVLSTFGLVWRNEICNKVSNWYNYMASTKWTCYIKHTEFALNIPGWARIEDTSTTGTGSSGKKPTVIGGKGPADVVSVDVPVRPPLEPDAEESSGRGRAEAL